MKNNKYTLQKQTHRMVQSKIVKNKSVKTKKSFKIQLKLKKKVKPKKKSVKKNKTDPEYVINNNQQIRDYLSNLQKYLDDKTLSERIKKFSIRRLLSANLYFSKAPVHMSSLLTYKLKYTWDSPLSDFDDEQIIPEFKSLLKNLHKNLDSNQSEFSNARLIIHTTQEDNIYNSEYMVNKYHTQ
jgi:hypothetical protein